MELEIFGIQSIAPVSWGYGLRRLPASVSVYA